MTSSSLACSSAVPILYLLASAAPMAAQSEPGIAGTYRTDVVLLENSCREAPIRPMPTVVKHQPGDSTMSLEHGGLEYQGVIRPDSTFAMQPRTVAAGDVTYMITVRGGFTSRARFEARVRVDVSGPGAVRCSYLVGWTGERARASDGAAGAESPSGALMRFEWTSTAGISSSSGDGAPHGFIVRVDEAADPVAITAHHVVERVRAEVGGGTASGGPGARLVPSGGTRQPVPLGPMLTIAAARTIDGQSWDRDVAAFALPRPIGAPVLTLAPDQPVEGDTVWLLAAVRGSSERLHPAVVIISRDSAFAYRYVRVSDGSLTSGAAVVDRSGRVVALNVGTVPITAERWARFATRFPGCCGGGPSTGLAGIGVGARALRRHLLPIVPRR